jgi:hypothetical protein
MSDFSELCPLFNTGVYSEITLPNLLLAGRSTTNKVDGGYAFGRSVIVTAAYLKKKSAFDATATATAVYLCRQASYAATKTVFASRLLSATDVTLAVGKWLPFTVTAKTFSATQVLAVRVKSLKTGMRPADVIVRFKEK